jgi:hypothetical protein
LHATLAARLDDVAAPASEEAATDEDEAEPTGGLQLAIELDGEATAAAPAAGEPN